MKPRDPEPSEITMICQFQSGAARRALQLSALGFLAGLGFIPGWHRLLGFSGFFGFIGVAFLIEIFHRLKHR